LSKGTLKLAMVTVKSSALSNGSKYIGALCVAPKTDNVERFVWSAGQIMWLSRTRNLEFLHLQRLHENACMLFFFNQRIWSSSSINVSGLLHQSTYLVLLGMSPAACSLSDQGRTRRACHQSTGCAAPAVDIGDKTTCRMSPNVNFRARAENGPRSLDGS
jgi:hypothetical protein